MSVQVDLSPLLGKLSNTMLLTNQLADIVQSDSEPFVPALNQDLTKSVIRVNTPTGVMLIYDKSYAAYQYGGQAMAYPQGTPVGWKNKREYQKVATGKPLNYTKTVHPHAHKQWVDQAFLVNGHNWEALVARGMGAS